MLEEGEEHPQEMDPFRPAMSPKMTASRHWVPVAAWNPTLREGEVRGKSAREGWGTCASASVSFFLREGSRGCRGNFRVIRGNNRTISLYRSILSERLREAPLHPQLLFIVKKRRMEIS